MTKNEKLVISALLIISLATFILAVVKSAPPVLPATAGLGKLYDGKSIALIHLSGVIADGEESGTLLNPQSGVGGVIRALREVRESNNFKAVILVINSPGGTVGTSQELYDEVKRVRASGKKVVVSMGDIAASGGYYVAAGADKIVAHPGTLTGSIGVIFNTMNFEEVMKKVGVKPEVVKSGPYKDIGSSTRAMTPEERRILQNLIDDSYDQFVTAVSEGRNMPKARVKALADGSIYTGRQAKTLGLVDQLGGYEEALDLVKKLAKLPESAEVYDFNQPSFWESILGASINQFTLSMKQQLLPLAGYNNLPVSLVGHE